jgi:hypothetical protein
MTTYKSNTPTVSSAAYPSEKGTKNEKFFLLTPEVRDDLLKADLTAAEWRIWSFLVSLDPFGDRGAKFSPAELMLKCGVGRATYFTAKAKFQRLGIFEFRDGITKVFNRQGYAVHSRSNDSQQGELINSEILDSKSEILDSKSEILDSKSEILDSNTEVLRVLL